MKTREELIKENLRLRRRIKDLEIQLATAKDTARSMADQAERGALALDELAEQRQNERSKWGIYG